MQSVSLRQNWSINRSKRSQGFTSYEVQQFSSEQQPATTSNMTADEKTEDRCVEPRSGTPNKSCPGAKTTTNNHR